MLPLAALVLAAAFLVLHLRAGRVEPRRWRVGVHLLGALWAAVAGLGLAVENWTGVPDDRLVPLLLLPWLGAVLLGLLLVGYGSRVLRPAERSRVALVSLVVGLAVLAATAAGIPLYLSGSGLPAVVAVVVLLLPGYAGLALLAYGLYCLTYLRRCPRESPAAVVVLGSGLVDGTVPRLLAHRLDAGAAAWREERGRGHDPLLVPTGGQGEDEPMSEGLAMTAYLVAHGVPPECVATEDRATTTDENLLLSREILRARGVADRHLRVVTSNFHVGRAALLSRRLGIDADVTGAPTAWDFLPGAFLREYVAALTLRPRTNLTGLTVWAASTAALAFAVMAP
ncbi:YdcF family protein [Terrabacter sp. NPDC080008]|uniref:YdcF family protein n=1 Tax=Terrabacter sp. NPDC080008 TaxID=3155176 RepID=UPI00344F0176